jgi:ABC-2 type transport system permease protein
MPGIFCGVGLALERDGGLMKLKRALPMPTGANFVAKVAMSLVFSAVALTGVVVSALVAGEITLSGTQDLTLWVIMLSGSIPFCAIGSLIGSLASGSAAPAFGNLVLLPMIWLSGMFIPLPESLEPWAVVWPAFHLNQLALGLAGIAEFSVFPPEISAVVLIGITVLVGGLAIRRLARIG